MQKIDKEYFYSFFTIPIIFLILILLAFYFGGHLLFHSLAEVFSILVGFTILVIVSYTYQFTKNNFLFYLGIGYFWIGILDFFHMLTFKGMPIYLINDSNITLTFWLLARFFEALLFISAPFVTFKIISKVKIFTLFGFITAAAYCLAFSQYAPVLFVENVGLTSLKISIEYLIIFIFVSSLFIYVMKRKKFDMLFYRHIIAAIVLTIFSELLFTLYANVNDYITIFGHLLKFISYWVIFLAIVKISLQRPFNFLAHETSTYNAIPFPSILVDAQGVIRQINNSTKTFLNLPQEEILNQSNHKIFHNQDVKEEECEICQAIKQGKTLLFHELCFEDKTYKFTTNSITLEDNTLGSVQVCIDISKEKDVEKQLNYEKNLLKIIIDTVPLTIFWKDTNSTYLGCNSKFSDAINLKSTSDIVGMNDYDMPWTEEAKQYVADDMETMKSKKSQLNYEEPQTLADGKTRWLNTSKVPLINKDNEVYGILGVFFDITDKKDNIKKLKDKKKELEIIIEEAPNPIMLHNEDGKVLLVNKVWKKLTGYSYEEIDTIGKWTQKAYGQNMQKVKDYIDSLYAHDETKNHGEFYIITKNGETIIWQFSSSYFGLIDDRRVLISSGMDITELKKKDEMMISQSRFAAMGEMISMIAHQWRQPISVISMNANNILLDINLDQVNNDELKNDSNSILENISHLSQTIDDFRDFFKPNKEKENQSVVIIINDSINMMIKSLENHSIKHTINSSTDEKILIFSRELLQVFINIIKNAIEALKEYRKTSRQINIDIKDENNFIKVKISNNGGQIEESNLPKIFDPYFSTKDEKNGTGLGLYMSKLIIEKHMNGNFFVKNIDEGVCFYIHIPKK